MKKTIIKFHCLCTKDYVDNKYTLVPNDNCPDCKGTGFYEREYPNTARVTIVEGE